MFRPHNQKQRPGNELYTARLVFQGHKAGEKEMIVNNVSSLNRRSVRLLASMAATVDWYIWSQDVKQAYTQSVYKMMSTIFPRPVKELRDAMKLPAGAFLELILPLNVVKEDGDYWDITFMDHQIDDLGIERTVGDQNLLYKIAQEVLNLMGLCGLVTDDSIQGGNKDFMDLTLATERKFESKPRVYNEFNFAGMNMKKMKIASSCSKQLISTKSRLQSSGSHVPYVKVQGVRDGGNEEKSWSCS